MEENFYDNDLERFLQQQVKHHRMYPSDAVWKGIYKQMHGYKRWPGLYFFAMLTVASLTLCTVFIESGSIIYPAQPVVAKATTLIYDQLDPAEVTHRTISHINNIQEAVTPQILATTIPTESFTETEKITVSRPAEIASTYDELANNDLLNTDLINTTTAFQPNEISQQIVLTDNNVFKPRTKRKAKTVMTGLEEAETAARKSANATDEYLEEHPEEVDRIIQQQVRTKQAKWEMQFYIAPSMNYRNIVDTKTSDGAAGGPVSNSYGVNASKVIRYQPGMGIEIGVGALYNFNKRLKIKAALQYNIRQYNIEAYAGTTELAKIALIRGGNVDTLTAISRFRSTGVYGEAQLLNKYHQVSLPVGIEYVLLSSKRFGFNIGGTLQPTYTFSENSYLLSADYKSYADGKSILRRWNLNSSVEALFTYKTRTVQWKLGPQLRYQHLPNYDDAYPIKEYLIDYGFKIGFTKAIK